MRTTETPIEGAIRGSLAILASAFLLGGCATPGAKRTAPVEVRDASGFSINESVRVSAGVRAEFDEANRALELNELDRAIELLAGLTRSSPQLTAAHINLGIAYQRKGALANAEASLKVALAQNPRHPVALNELGIVERRTGDFGSARAHFETALSLHPDFQPARKNLGILCDLYLADRACALAQYELYHAAVPGDEPVGLWIADLRNQAGS